MSKVVCSVAVELTRNNLANIAQIVIDRIEDDFGCDAMLVAGLYEDELMNALIDNPKFQSVLARQVSQDGLSVCEDPYGYFDAFDFIETIPGLQRIYDLVDEASDIMQDAEKEETKCIPVPAGYKLVKI